MNFRISRCRETAHPASDNSHRPPSGKTMTVPLLTMRSASARATSTAKISQAARPHAWVRRDSQGRDITCGVLQRACVGVGRATVRDQARVPVVPRPRSRVSGRPAPGFGSAAVPSRGTGDDAQTAGGRGRDGDCSFRPAHRNAQPERDVASSTVPVAVSTVATSRNGFTLHQSRTRRRRGGDGIEIVVIRDGLLLARVARNRSVRDSADATPWTHCLVNCGTVPVAARTAQ